MVDFDENHPAPFLAEQSLYLGAIVLAAFLLAEILHLVIAGVDAGATAAGILGVLPDAVRYTGLAVAGLYAVSRGMQ